MAWFILLFAGILEIAWAYYLKQSMGFTKLIPSLITVVTAAVSFLLLAISMRSLPLGTAYAVWTGIGVVGTFVLAVFVLGEEVTPIKIIATAFIVIGLVLLKVSTSN